jgi:hypothetical protein
LVGRRTGADATHARLRGNFNPAEAARVVKILLEGLSVASRFEWILNHLPLETGRWDRARMEQALEPVVRFRERFHVPVGCHEFGVYAGGADHVSQLAWMRDFLSLLRDHDLGWSFWNYLDLDLGLISRHEALFARSPQHDHLERTDNEMVKLPASH